MKKFIVLIVLAGLIILGVYALQGDQGKGPDSSSSPGNITSDNKGRQETGVQDKEQSQAPHQDNGQPTTDVQDKAQQLTVGINKGNLAPDFALKSQDGKVMKLSDFRGKRVILNMWATWCPPCRLEMPDMEKYYSEYNKEGIEILAVNMTTAERNRADVPAFIKEYGLTFHVLMDDNGEAAKLYNVFSIPSSFILDSQGVIREKITGPMTYEYMKGVMESIK